MLEQEFTYYIKHQGDFVEDYNGKVIVLQGVEILRVFDTIGDAYWWALDEDLLGKVLIHKVGPGIENYTFEISATSVQL